MKKVNREKISEILKSRHPEVDQDEVLEALNLLGFDFKKHSSLKKALFEILNKPEYASILNDTTHVIVNAEHANQVKNILKAYEKLKVFEDEISADLFSLEEVKEELDEFVVLKENGTRILKKDKELFKYDDIYKCTEKLNDDTFYIKDKKIYNLQGVCIYDKEFVYCCSISYNILKLYPKEDLLPYFENYNQIPDKMSLKEIKQLIGKNEDIGCFLSITGGNVVKSSSNLEKIMNSPFSFEQMSCILSLLRKGKKLDYLSQTIYSCDSDGFICTSLNEGICYYKYTGEKIFDSNQLNYIYADKEIKNNENIIVVGKLDKKMNKVYGYYDLNKRCEVGSIQFSYVHPWFGYGGCTMDSPNIIHFIDENGKVYSDKINPYHNTFPIICYSVPSSCKLDSFDYIKDLMRYNKKEPDAKCSYYVIDSMFRLEDKIFIGHFKCKSPYMTHLEKEAEALVKIINGKPVIFSFFYRKIGLFSKEKRLCLAQMPYSSVRPSAVVQLSFDGNESMISLGEAEKLNKKRDENKIYELEISLKNSLFLEDHYKNTLPKISENRSLKEKEIQIANIRREYLNTVDDFSFESASLPENFESLFCCKKGLGGLEFQNGWYEKTVTLFDDLGNYFVYEYGDEKNITLDEFNHILITLYLEDKRTKMLLLEPFGKMLIGLSNSITIKDVYYMVERGDGKKQLFDKNALPFTIPCDDVGFATKYYVSKTGEVKKKIEKIWVKNSEFIYLLDDDRDYTIYEDLEYENLLGEARKLLLENSYMEE